MPTDSYQVYCLFLAVQAHFQTDYDAFKYGFKTRANKDSFLNHKSRFIFQKLGRKYSKLDIVNLFVANNVYRTASWVGDVDEDVLPVFQKNNENLEYNFKGDLETIIDKGGTKKGFKALFKCHDGQHAPIFDLLLTKKINIESFIVLNEVFPFFQLMPVDLYFKPIWHTMERVCLKYRPFIKYDKAMIKKTFISQVENLLTDSNNFGQ